ncbi:hypothetical protein ACFFX0_28580 [Citricoccus parietis]|uniref:C3H1-type domain-containing protein n=1 Tax=Citricoccus parietis TaxID=592307 RepID=A0ABV5G7L1_9MICC
MPLPVHSRAPGTSRTGSHVSHGLSTHVQDLPYTSVQGPGRLPNLTVRPHRRGWCERGYICPYTHD